MSKNITKKDLVDEIANRICIKDGDARPIIDEFFECIVAHLLNGERIEIRGFGAFDVQRRKGRPARNPRTGKPADIPDRIVPILRFSRAVKDGVALRLKFPV